MKKVCRYTILRICLPVILLLAFTRGLGAQDLDMGISAGFNLGTPYGVANDGASGSPGLGPALGFYLKSRLSMKWQLQVELLYSKKGSFFQTPVSGDTIYRSTLNDTMPYSVHTVYNGWVEGHFNNAYLDIPLIFEYEAGPRWSLMMGPQFSYLLKGENKGTADIEVGNPKNPFTYVEDQLFDQSKHLRKWDYAILLGTTYQFRDKIQFQLTASYGLFSIYEEYYKYINKTVRNIYLRVGILYRMTD